MAHDPSDGPLGLEGRHEFKAGDAMPPGTQASVFIYGRHRPDLGTSWIKAKRITGLHGLGDGDAFAEPAEGRSGEIFYPGAERGKTVVYEGMVAAKGHSLAGLKAMRQKAQVLRGVARDTRERRLGSMTIVDPLSTGSGYAVEHLRTIAFEMDDEQTRPLNHRYPWQREFTLGVRTADTRAVWYPIELEDDNAAGATVVLGNLGNAPADLKFDVYSTGTGMDVVLENLTLGKQLKFDNMPIPAGDLLRVDWTNRAAVWAEAANLPDYNPNTDMMPYLDHELSDWWDAMEWGLGRGNNSIKVDGTNVDTWDVSFQHSAE